MKRIGTAVLCFVMLFALLAFPGFAAETEKTATAASSEDILLRGYQNQLNTTGASAVSVRIIAEIANVENYTEVGFYITTANEAARIDGLQQTDRHQDGRNRYGI